MCRSISFHKNTQLILFQETSETSAELRIGLCCSDLVRKPVSYPGSLISKCPQAVPSEINSGYMCLIFFPKNWTSGPPTL